MLTGIAWPELTSLLLAARLTHCLPVASQSFIHAAIINSFSFVHFVLTRLLCTSKLSTGHVYIRSNLDGLAAAQNVDSTSVRQFTRYTRLSR